MKRLKRGEIGLLLLPVLILIFVGYFLQGARGKPHFAIESTQVLPLPAEVESVSGGPFDTQVEILIRHNRSFFQRFSEKTTSWGLEGERVFYTDKNGKERDIERISESIKPRKNGLWVVTYLVALEKVPKGAKVILTASITRNGISVLPVNVRLK